MKHIIIAVIFLAGLSFQSFSQGGKYNHNRELIKEKKYTYVKSKLQLTDKEEKEFMPLYKAFDNERDKTHDARRKAMWNFKKNHLNMKNDDLNKLIDDLSDFEIKLAQINKTYNNKFKTVLPPMKIILLHQTENEFKRHLLRGSHSKGSGQRK